MSEAVNLNVPKWATDANFDAGSDAWSGHATKVQPPDGILAKGAIPKQQVAAQHFNYQLGAMGDSLSNLARATVHSALQTWRQSALSVTGSTVYSELVGLLPKRSYDTNGDRQRVPVVFGKNTADSNRAYMSRSIDGSSWDSGTEISITGGVHLTNPVFSAAGEPGAMIIGQGSSPSICYTTNHGASWTLGTVGSFGGQVYALHYAAGASKYLVAHGLGVFAASTLSGLTSAAITTVPTPSASGITTAEFADDGGSNFVMVATCSAVSNPALYHSGNGGTSWTKVQDLGSTTAPGNVKFSKYLGKFVAWDNAGVWTSIDGATWVQVAGTVGASADMITGSGSFAICGAAIVKLWRNVLESGSYQQYGIAYSLDVGSTWNCWGFSRPFGSTPAQIRSFNNRLYVNDAGLLWVSGAVGLPGAES